MPFKSSIYLLYLFAQTTHAALLELNYRFTDYNERLSIQEAGIFTQDTNTTKLVGGDFIVSIDTLDTPEFYSHVHESGFQRRVTVDTSFYSKKNTISEVPFLQEYLKGTLLPDNRENFMWSRLYGAYVSADYHVPYLEDYYLKEFALFGYLREIEYSFVGDWDSGSYSETITTTYASRSISFREELPFQELHTGHPTFDDIISQLTKVPVTFIANISHYKERRSYENHELTNTEFLFTKTAHLTATANYVPVSESSTLGLYLMALTLISIRKKFQKPSQGCLHSTLRR